MNSKLRIVVTGMIGQYPLGGVAWDYVQYVTGLSRLGHDVWYIEDTGQWPYAPESDGVSKGCDYTLRYLAEVFGRFGLGERWAYRFPWQDQWFGIAAEQRREVLDTADLLLNVSGMLERPEHYRSVKRLAYIDSDPVFTQVKIARGNDYLRNLIDQHDVVFTFGEQFGAEVPVTGHSWLPTRQPVVLDDWRTDTSPRPCYTTVMNWSSYNPIEYQGRQYGHKDLEFDRFLDLPSRVKPTLELAAKSGRKRKLPVELLRHKGWQLVDPDVVCGGLESYRSYLQSSRAEWSVAKNGYVQGQSGWFSCRSACYLAAGRPVVVQETGFSKVLPTGLGIVPFRDLDEAIAGIESVEANYDAHCRAARELAAHYFDSDQVLQSLLERAMAGA